MMRQMTVIGQGYSFYCCGALFFENVCRNCLNSMETVSPEPDSIVNVPTLLSGSTLSQLSEKAITPTALSYISYICLSLKGELFCSQLFYIFQPWALFLCQSQSRTDLSENPRGQPKQELLELFWEKKIKKNRKLGVIKYQGTILYAWIFL